MDITPSKTKVLYVITKSNFGGAQRYVYDLATNLPESKFDVLVATGGSGTLVQKLQEKGVRTIPLFSLTRDVNASSDFSAFVELLKLFKNERPDVVHLNSAKAGGVGALAARFANVPNIIFTAHGWAFNEERPLFERILIKLFSWITVILSHKTIAVSDAIARNMSWPFAASKISVIKNSIGTTQLYSRAEARELLSNISHTIIPQNALIVGTIAELHPSKGLKYSIEAAAALIKNNPDIYYLILGDGQEKEKISSLIKDHKLEGRVLLLGFVNDAARYLKAFDCFVLPSITEGMGYVLLEAGLAKLPVVATNVGGIPEVITHNETGLLVPSRDVAAITKALENIFQSESFREDIGNALYKKVTHDFVLDNMIQKTTELYSK